VRRGGGGGGGSIRGGRRRGRSSITDSSNTAASDTTSSLSIWGVSGGVPLFSTLPAQAQALVIRLERKPTAPRCDGRVSPTQSSNISYVE
jgi:hypothetical protein